MFPGTDKQSQRLLRTASKMGHLETVEKLVSYIITVMLKFLLFKKCSKGLSFSHDSMYNHYFLSPLDIVLPSRERVCECC